MDVAVKWCNLATEYAASTGGKPWRYTLFPQDVITSGRRKGWAISTAKASGRAALRMFARVTVRKVENWLLQNRLSVCQPRLHAADSTRFVEATAVSQNYLINIRVPKDFR